MRAILFGLMFLLSTGVIAQVKTFTITNTICGEIDPFLIGDACILQVKETSTSQSHLVIIDLDLIVEHYSGVHNFTGMFFTADLDLMRRADTETRKYLARWYSINRQVLVVHTYDYQSFSIHP
jgi:hypothetical protein